MVYSTRRFVVCLSVCHFVLVFFRPFSIAITSLGEERANLSAFRTFVRSVCACLDLSVSSSSWGLGWAAVCDCGTPWTFSYLFWCKYKTEKRKKKCSCMTNTEFQMSPLTRRRQNIAD